MSRSRSYQKRRRNRQVSAWDASWRAYRNNVRTGLARVRSEVEVAGAGVPRREKPLVTNASTPPVTGWDLLWLDYKASKFAA